MPVPSLSRTALPPAALSSVRSASDHAGCVSPVTNVVSTTPFAPAGGSFTDSPLPSLRAMMPATTAEGGTERSSVAPASGWIVNQFTYAAATSEFATARSVASDERIVAAVAVSV
jgi:hypothetical protein